MAKFVTIGELQKLAAQKIPGGALDFVLAAGGAGQTYERNKRALAALAIEQEILIGSDPIDIRTTFLGIPLPSPVIVCPMGGLARLYPEAELAMARGVGRDGTLWATPCRDASIEETADMAPGPLLYQTYCDEAVDRGEQRELIARVEAKSEFKGVVVTVDSISPNRPDRLLEARPFGARPLPPGSGIPWRHFTWENLDRLRSDVHLPMGLKGIMSAADAERAIDHGADFVWVSNHGGRHLDSGRASIDVLEEVVERVGGRVPVIVDSGFERGSDVIKAIAKGATLVGFGKPAACALGVEGGEGVATFLKIVNEELLFNLALSGKSSLRQVGPEMIRRVGY